MMYSSFRSTSGCNIAAIANWVGETEAVGVVQVAEAAELATAAAELAASVTDALGDLVMLLDPETRGGQEDADSLGDGIELTLGVTKEVGEDDGNNDAKIVTLGAEEPEGEVDGDGMHESVGGGTHHKAYKFLSSEPTYIVPSAPMAREDVTDAPVV
jgi:hypothetical protein